MSPIWMCLSAKKPQKVNSESCEISDKVLTLPNVISFVRLLMVPVFFVLLLNGYRFESLAFFILASITDFVDGQVARRTNSVSKLGKLLDPAIDTILMFTGVLGVVLIGQLPLWIALLVFAREAFLLIGAFVLLSMKQITIAVIYPGKIATTLLFIGFAGMILGQPLIEGLNVTSATWLPGFNQSMVPMWIWFVYSGLLLQVAVTIFYCIKAIEKLRNGNDVSNINAF